eukprot:365842-Chlamydomonas_euryale.AAC.3
MVASASTASASSCCAAQLQPHCEWPTHAPSALCSLGGAGPKLRPPSAPQSPCPRCVQTQRISTHTCGHD